MRVATYRLQVEDGSPVYRPMSYTDEDGVVFLELDQVAPLIALGSLDFPPLLLTTGEEMKAAAQVADFIARVCLIEETLHNEHFTNEDRSDS